MPKQRISQYLKHWILDTILSNSEPTKANSVKVIKHLSGPNQDGAIIREVTDGNVFIKAVFSNEALEEMFSEEGSSQPEWYSALLILKKYTVCFDGRDCLERSEFIIKVTSACVWDLQQKTYLKYRVTDCMDNQQVKDLAKEAYDNYQQVHNRGDSMDCSIPLTQLLENMTDIESQDSQGINNTDFKKNFSVEEFIIPPQQHVLLESIQEWKSDYVPSLEEFTQTPSEKTSVGVEKGTLCNYKEDHKTYQKEFIKYFQMNEQKPEKTSEIVSSGESIRLSCSDHSGDETAVGNHGDGLKIIVTSSSEDNNEQNSEQKGDNSAPSDKKIQKNKTDAKNPKKTKSTNDLSVSDGSVSSTVNIHETQPFSPTMSTTQGFSPQGIDPLISPRSRKSSSDSTSSQDKKRMESNTSDQSLICDTPEDNKIIPVKLDSHRKDYQKSQVGKHANDIAENSRLMSLSNKINFKEDDHEENSRLSKMTSSSEVDSAEQLLRRLDKPSSSLSVDENVGSSPEGNQSQSSSQKSISDSMLMEISSGQMRTVLAGSSAANVDKSDCVAIGTSDDACDMDTQDPNESVNKNSSKRDRAGSAESEEPVHKVRKLDKSVNKKSDINRQGNSNGTTLISDSGKLPLVSLHKETLKQSKSCGKEKSPAPRKCSEKPEDKYKYKSLTEKNSSEKEIVKNLEQVEDSPRLLNPCDPKVFKLVSLQSTVKKGAMHPLKKTVVKIPYVIYSTEKTKGEGLKDASERTVVKGLLNSPGKALEKGPSVSPGKSLEKGPSVSPGKSLEKGLSVSSGKLEKGLSVSSGKLEKGLSASPGKSTEKRLLVSQGKSSDNGLLVELGKSTERGLFVEPRKTVKKPFIIACPKNDVQINKRPPVSQKEEAEIIVISSGDSEEQMLSTVQLNSNTPKDKEVNSVEVLENRQRNLCTQSDITSPGRISEHSIERVSNHSIGMVSNKDSTNGILDHSKIRTSDIEPDPSSSRSEKDVQQREPKSQPQCSLLEQFLSEIQPVTEIGKKLMTLTIPDELSLSAFTYYKNGFDIS